MSERSTTSLTHLVLVNKLVLFRRPTGDYHLADETPYSFFQVFVGAGSFQKKTIFLWDFGCLPPTAGNNKLRYFVVGYIRSKNNAMNLWQLASRDRRPDESIESSTRMMKVNVLCWVNGVSIKLNSPNEGSYASCPYMNQV